MMNMLNQSTLRVRLTKIKFLSVLAVTALALTSPFVFGDSPGSQANHLAGTWMSRFEPGVAAPTLISYTSDGRVIFSRPTTIGPMPAPGLALIVGTGHGEWIRTGNHEFASTVMFLGSDLATEFSFFVKVVSAIKLNDASDELTETGTVTITFADGTGFSFPSPGSGIYTRIVAGQ